MEPGEENGKEVRYNVEPGGFIQLGHNRTPDPKKDKEDSGSWFEDY